MIAMSAISAASAASGRSGASSSPRGREKSHPVMTAPAASKCSAISARAVPWYSSRACMVAPSPMMSHILLTGRPGGM